jgi:hypothetical protein
MWDSTQAGKGKERDGQTWVVFFFWSKQSKGPRSMDTRKKRQELGVGPGVSDSDWAFYSEMSG